MPAITAELGGRFPGRRWEYRGIVSLLGRHAPWESQASQPNGSFSCLRDLANKAVYLPWSHESR